MHLLRYCVVFLCGFVGATALFAATDSFDLEVEVFLLSVVLCTGGESSLFECDHNGLRGDNCGLLEAAGVRCQGTGNLICVHIIL